MNNNAEKSEQPTARRLKEAKKKGKVFVSKDITVLAVLLSATCAIYFMLDSAEQKLILFSRQVFHDAGNHSFDYQFLSNLMNNAFNIMMYISGPFWIIIFFSSILIVFAQGGVAFTAETVKPKLERLSMIEGFKRIYSMKSFFEIVKSLFKLLACLVLFYFTLKDYLRLLVISINSEFRHIPIILKTISFQTINRILFFFSIIAVADYCFQRWHYKKQLKMTKQEIKQDYKEEEGDPHIKMRRKQLHEEYVFNSIFQETQHADVVVVNPREIAVAVKYEINKMNAPRVVAKGEGLYAKKIRETAEYNNIPVMENVLLAHALFKVKVGNEIPVELYETVAEVLNFVYRLAMQSANRK